MGDSDQEVYMDKELEKAVIWGDLSFLEEAVKREKESGDGNFHYFLRKSQRWNVYILHLGIYYDKKEWVEAALKLLPPHVIQQLLLHRDIWGDTPLHFAVSSTGSMEIMKLLDEYLYEIKNGDVDEITKFWVVKDSDGDTVLHKAALSESVDAVKYLVGKYPGLASILNNSDETFLHLAVEELKDMEDMEDMEFLRAVDDEIEDEDYKKKLWSIRNSEGNTPLHSAAIHGQTEFVEFLMERHPQLFSLVNHKKETPLQVEITKYPDLLACKLENSKSSYIHLAAALNRAQFLRAVNAEFGDEDDKNKLWRMPNADGNIPLHCAAIFCSTEVVQFFMESHPQLARALNYKQQTPLHLAIKHYETIDFSGKEIEEVPGIIKSMVEIESRVACWQDVDGFTPLHRAAFLCTIYNVEVISFILQHSSESAQVLDSFGNTILHLMINKITSYQQGKDLLSIPEISVLNDTMNNEGKKPLDCARELNIIMVRVLLDASTKQSSITGQCISVATLIQHQNELETMENRKMKMEEYGLITSEVRIIRKLVHKFGMNFLLSRDSNKRNILHKLLHINNAISITIDSYVEFVQEILVNYPMLVCQSDVNGDTPVHILARNSPAVQSYISNNNNSYELKSLDKSILSLKLLELCRIYYYKARASQEGNHYPPPWLVQNIAGNTPLHDSLIMNYNKELVRELYKLDINIVGGLINKNKETPLHLLAGRSSTKNKEYDVEEDTKTLIKAYGKALKLSDQDGCCPLQRAIRVGNLGSTSAILDENNMEKTIICDAEGHLWLHEIMDKFSILKKNMSKRNQNGNTPLHLAIERQNLKQHATFFVKISSIMASMKDNKDESPKVSDVFTIKDNDGNTPLHLAIQSGRSTFIVDIFKLSGLTEFVPDSRKLLSIKDNQGRTPLHLSIVLQRFEIMKIILKASIFEELIVQDNEGNTALHFATQSGHSKPIADIFELSGLTEFVPDSRKLLSIKDNQGRTPLHLSIVLQRFEIMKMILKASTFKELIVQDNEGNTPLHLAILGGHFDFVLEFLKFVFENLNVDLKEVHDLLMIENKDGRTPSALIGSKKELPSGLEEYFMKEPNLVGYRSVYGIAKTEMKDYVNTMGVIAALLATITFTAALSVPGGPNQNDGTPTLLKHASFQAFMFFDVLTMCLSTMVLFCLLWIMAAGSGRKSVMLMDFSLWLLQISFYTTLLTFMTGVYATIFPIKHWIAIYTLALCSAIMLLMRKNIVIHILGPWMCNLIQHYSNGMSTCARYIKAIVHFCNAVFCSKKLFGNQQEDHTARV